MRSPARLILALALSVAPVIALAQPGPKPVRLEEIGPCMWGNLDSQTQTQLTAAFDAGIEQYARASSSLGPRITVILPQCWTASADDQFAASYIAGMGLTQEVLARLIARDESVERPQLDAAIAQTPAALKDQLMRTARELYAGQRPAPPAMTPIFQTLGLSVDPAYLQSPRGRRVATYIGQSFQILVAATEPAPANRRQSVALPDMGRCVWDKLSAEERAPFLTALQDGNSEAFATAETALAQRSFTLALDCAPSLVADQATAGKMMSLSLRQEASAGLIARELVIGRARLDEALATAPSGVTTPLQQTAEALIRQQPAPTAQSMDPIFQALGQPLTPEFRASKPAQWITSYYLYFYAIRVLAAQFGAPPPQPPP